MIIVYGILGWLDWSLLPLQRLVTSCRCITLCLHSTYYYGEWSEPLSINYGLTLIRFMFFLQVNKLSFAEEVVDLIPYRLHFAWISDTLGLQANKTTAGE